MEMAITGRGSRRDHPPPEGAAARESLASSLSTWRATRSARYLSSCGLSKVVHHLAIARISLKLVSQELAALLKQNAPMITRLARSYAFHPATGMTVISISSYFQVTQISRT